MALDVVNIDEVPHSPHTSWNDTEVHNPLDEDFHWMYDGKPLKPVPANGKEVYPEFQARLIAKHLAMKIVAGNHDKEIQAEVAKQSTEAARAAAAAASIPGKRVANMMEWLLSPIGASPEKTPVKGTILAPELEVGEAIKKDYSNLNWSELRKAAKEKGLYKIGMTKEAVIKQLEKEE